MLFSRPSPWRPGNRFIRRWWDCRL